MAKLFDARPYELLPTLPCRCDKVEMVQSELLVLVEDFLRGDSQILLYNMTAAQSVDSSSSEDHGLLHRMIFS